jgi:hypothetical protein
VTFDAASQDGRRVFFETAEVLVTSDTDTAQDVYSSTVSGGYPRPKGATPLRVSLVPAFQQCTSGANSSHGSPLAYPSCNPPLQASSYLTVGTPDANTSAANFTGSAKFESVNGNAGTTANEADVKITASLVDVRRKSDLGDYTGQLQLVPTLRITDKLNGSAPIDPATVADLDFPVTIPCAATADTTVGSTSSVATTANAVLPGAVVEIKRTIMQLGQVRVFDGGSDGIAATAGNTLFADQGIFVP